MATQATSVMTMPQERQPAQLPARPRPDRPDSLAGGQGDGGVRPLEIAECSLCGITRPLGLLVPDGGSACADIRWYCKDAKSCTERWTAARPRTPAWPPTAPGHTAAAAVEPAPARAEAPAERLDGSPDRVPSVT
jgi:hypothetical protein